MIFKDRTPIPKNGHEMTLSMPIFMTFMTFNLRESLQSVLYGVGELTEKLQSFWPEMPESKVSKGANQRAE